MLDISKVYSSNECGEFSILEYVNNKEVEVLFKDPELVVICSVKFPTNLRSECRKYVDTIIINEDDPSSKFFDKLNLCYQQSQI